VVIRVSVVAAATTRALSGTKWTSKRCTTSSATFPSR
jgi:hypothetical protein